MRRAYLTRGLPRDSPLFDVARRAGYELRAEATLSIRYERFVYPDAPDWLFAYSAHAVHGFFQGIGCRTWLQCMPAIKFAAIGTGTAEAWRANRIEVDFVGAGSPAAVSTQFEAVAGGQRVAFLQARESRESVATQLGGRITATTVPTYRSEIRPDLRPPRVEVALLTSPKSADAFLRAYAKTHGAEAVAGLLSYAIGVTTATAVGAAGYPVTGVAPEVSVRGLVETLFEVNPWRREASTRR